MLTVRAVIRQTPPDSSGQHQLERRELSVVADSYEAGAAVLSEQIPEGWQVLYWRSERDDPTDA